MLSNICLCLHAAVYMLLFLVVVVNSNQFQIYMLLLHLQVIELTYTD